MAVEFLFFFFSKEDALSAFFVIVVFLFVLKYGVWTSR